MSEPSAHGASPADDGRGAAAARAAGHARRVPRVVRRAERRVLGRRAHRELVGVRLAEHAQAVLPCSARRRSRRTPGRSSRGSSSRPSCGCPWSTITSLSAIGSPSPPGSSASVEVRVQLGVALVDRGAVRGEELGAADLAALEQPPAPPRRSAAACRSLMPAAPGRNRRRGRARSRTPRRASGTAAARPRPRRSAISSGCEVGGTSERSSSDTFETASRIAESCSWNRVTSSSVSSSRASRATCSTSSLVIPAIDFDPSR